MADPNRIPLSFVVRKMLWIFCKRSDDKQPGFVACVHVALLSSNTVLKPSSLSTLQGSFINVERLTVYTRTIVSTQPPFQTMMRTDHIRWQERAEHMGQNFSKLNDR